MKIVVVQLSDFHIKSAGATILGRAQSIASAVRAIEPTVELCVVGFVGDISFSGQRQQLDAAKTFRDSLAIALADLESHPSVEFVAVPGNHDCDFSVASELRGVVLESLPSRIGSLTGTSDLIAQCVAPQVAFAEFESQIATGTATVISPLASFRDITVGSFRIRFLCVNSAWMSQKDELQGSLLFPTHLFPSDTSQDVDLTISCVHHPMHWFESTNRRALSEYLEEHSDIVLTGHEHTFGSYSKRDLTDPKETLFVEGCVLASDEAATESAFNLCVIDLKSKTFRVVEHSWLGGDRLYEVRKETDRVPLGAGKGRKDFTLTNTFIDFLRDPGAGYSHPRQARLQLEDLFIYPDLKVRPIDKRLKGDFKAQEPIRSADVPRFLSEQTRLVVAGADKAGKTALAKVLFRQWFDDGKLPVLLNGRDLTTTNETTLDELLQRQVAAIYGPSVWTKFRQHKHEDKFVVIDDIHLSRYNQKGYKAFIQFCASRFERIVVLADDVFNIESLARLAEEGSPFGTFNHAEIRPFGWRLRGKLIERWVTLGREDTAGAGEVAHQVHLNEQLISTLLGKNLLPSYPLTILTILQTSEAGRPLNTTTGEYGYLYEELITRALSEVQHKASTIDTRYNFLAHLAYVAFTKHRDKLSRQETKDVIDSFCDKYRLNFDGESLVRQLDEARLLQIGSDSIGFKYRYVHYYFVARYFFGNIGDPSDGDSLRESLNHLADTIFAEDNANIIIFYLYLSRDRLLLKRLLSNASSIYREYDPCNFQSDVEFVNTLYRQTRELVLPEGNPSEHVDRYRDKLDATDGEEQGVERDKSDVEYSDALSDVIKINIAFKTLQVIGQVLRNFPGSLRGDEKLEIARECYLLGLRTLKVILALTETHLDDWRIYFAKLIQERRAFDSTPELAKQTDEFLIWMTLISAYGIVRIISMSVGDEQLSQTYAEVMNLERDNVSIALIDLSIKLDHFKALPEADVEELAARLKDNGFAFTVLRDLVANHLYLFPVDYKVRQRLGSILNIRTTDQKYVDNPSKLLPPSQA